jgi:anaerobic selenocysteine-containing dehydrogenase
VLPDTRTVEDIHIALAAGPQGIQPNNDASNPAHLGGVGLNGFGAAQDLTKSWHWFRRMIANVAFEDLPGTGVEGSGDERANINYVLDRGGRYEDGSGLGTTFHSHTKSFLLHFYIESIAKTVNSQKGQKDFSPLGKYESIRAVNNQVINDGSAFPLKVITYKDSFHSMARTICNPSLVGILPENSVEMNSSDAQARNIVTGDKIRITSASHPKGLEAKAFVSEGIRPGVVAIRHCYGHWEMSSRPYIVSGTQSGHDASRSAGLSMNPLARIDPVLGDVSLQDILGGSVSFGDTQVEVVKI